MNVLLLFDGISCGQIALERAGIKIDKYYASEIDDYAIQVTQKNYPNTIQLGDVTKLDRAKLESLGKVDLLIGGTPCQDLSIARHNRQGLDGNNSSLFYEYIRVLEIKKPKYFFLENVGSMKKEDKDIITSYLEVEPIYINSNIFSAQSRARYYWTNIPHDELPKTCNIVVRDILEDSVDKKYYLKKNYTYIKSENKHSRTGMRFVCGIVSSKKWLEDGKNLSRNFPQGNRVYSIDGKSATLTANGGGLGGKTGLYYLEDGQEFDKSNIRRLTPLECERLQTIPDGYTDILSDTQRYKTIGNGWTVDVIAHIFKGLNSK